LDKPTVVLEFADCGFVDTVLRENLRLGRKRLRN